MVEMVVVGLGHAWKQFYAQTLAEMGDAVRVVAVVDSNMPPPGVADAFSWFGSVADIPDALISNETAALVLTPDHYPVIAELANRGVKRIIVEKPLVSRDSEILAVRSLVEQGIKIYAIDFYIPKLFSLARALGQFAHDDPRRAFVRVDAMIENWTVKELLGEIEGITVAIVEAGGFCLPDLEKRPWLEKDPEIGGMLRDLGTHAFAPLIASGLITRDAKVHYVSLDRISADRKSIVPLERDGEGVEMYVSALLEAENVPVSVAFGKVPFEKGGLWELSVRGSKGRFSAGLRTGQPAVLVSNKGDVVRFSLTKTTYEIVLTEALWCFEGELPGFDGNTGAFFEAMTLLQKMRANYFNRG